MDEGALASLVRELFDYDPLTGVFIRKIARSNCVKAGEVAGCKNANGYLVIGINGRLHYAHRLAWLYVHGVWPAQLLDHINGDPSDNRMENLREATDGENRQNVAVRRDNQSGLAGVSKLSHCRRWSAKIQINRQSTYLGCFKSPEEAHAAYLSAKARLHQFQPTPRSI